MPEHILQHEAPDARAGIERRQDEHRLEHDREVIPDGHAGRWPKVAAEDARHADRERRRAAGAREERALAHLAWRALASARRVTGKSPARNRRDRRLRASLPTTPAALLMAKYTPGSSSVAAIIAMIATKDSSAMLP